MTANEVAGTAAVLLAAGAGSRFSAEEHKLLAHWRGRPVVAWAVEHAVKAEIGPTWVITGAIDLGHVLPEKVEVFPNAQWALGQATSLAAAVRVARERKLEAIVVGLGDQPQIEPSAWRAVASADAPIAAATYRGRYANPVKLRHDVWGLLDTEGDEGARSLMRSRTDLVTGVGCEGNPVDVDTVEDLASLS